MNSCPLPHCSSRTTPAALFRAINAESRNLKSPRPKPGSTKTTTDTIKDFHFHFELKLELKLTVLSFKSKPGFTSILTPRHGFQIHHSHYNRLVHPNLLSYLHRTSHEAIGFHSAWTNILSTTLLDSVDCNDSNTSGQHEKSSEKMHHCHHW